MPDKRQPLALQPRNPLMCFRNCLNEASRALEIVICARAIAQKTQSNKKPAMPINMRAFGRYRMISDGYVVPRTGIEPVRRLSLAADFKSAVSTNFTIGARQSPMNTGPLPKAGRDSTRAVWRISCALLQLSAHGAASRHRPVAAKRVPFAPG